MKTHLLFCCLLLTATLQAQSLDQYVIASAGNYSTTSTGTSLSATIGEPLTTTVSSSTAILTQGFQQPIDITLVNTQNVNQVPLDIQVFPNPTAAYITIEQTESNALNADLYDILGQHIGSYSINDYQTQIDLQRLPAANYLLRIRDNANQTIQSFKIQKTQ